MEMLIFNSGKTTEVKTKSSPSVKQVSSMLLTYMKIWLHLAVEKNPAKNNQQPTKKKKKRQKDNSIHPPLNTV